CSRRLRRRRRAARLGQESRLGRGRGIGGHPSGAPGSRGGATSRPATDRRLPVRATGMNRRIITWVVVLAVPMAGLVVLIARPQLDVAWEHHPAHFWIVLIAAALSTALAYATGTAARRRNDARVYLV